MATYYIDFTDGRTENNGLSPDKARSSYTDLALQPGDTVLFRRGSFVRGMLEAKEYICYGAYGEGELPTFCGSVDVSNEWDWMITQEENVWKCSKLLRGDVGNLIFNVNECSATLRWTKEELCRQGDFYSCPLNAEEAEKKNGSRELYLYSVGHPARAYSQIEAAAYDTRCMVKLAAGMTLEDIRVINSGVHGMAGQGNGITVRRCVFENIGGCPWSHSLKIRFGNGLEIWHRGNNILVENCVFKNIYDSCVTHQGPGEETQPTDHFVCRNCTFDTYGMAAFEYRDKLPIRSVFENNRCLNAGCGFAMLGESKPRSSEIWPQPMGHHIFLWRIPAPTEGGDLVISDNMFGAAPEGAAIYSIISPEAEAQITLKNNIYTPNDTLLVHFGGTSYTSLEEYRKQTGKDCDSRYVSASESR
ncbi:MAG: hypothetical protein E7618_03360 [Ruminococcaceae bacterium]|nr:hypothetical protein [Oscillospiraceae bacterium]